MSPGWNPNHVNPPEPDMCGDCGTQHWGDVCPENAHDRPHWDQVNEAIDAGYVREPGSQYDEGNPCRADWLPGGAVCDNPANMEYTDQLGFHTPCCDECWHAAQDLEVQP